MSLFSKVSGSTIAVAALIGLSPVAAQPADVAPPAEPMTQSVGSHIYVTGAIRERGETATPAKADDKNVPELPVVYEDDPQG